MLGVLYPKRIRASVPRACSEESKYKFRRIILNHGINWYPCCDGNIQGLKRDPYSDITIRIGFVQSCTAPSPVKCLKWAGVKYN